MILCVEGIRPIGVIDVDALDVSLEECMAITKKQTLNNVLNERTANPLIESLTNTIQNDLK